MDQLNVPGGRLLFVAGQIGWNEEQELVGKSFVKQFRQALRNGAAVVKTAGGAPEHVVRFTMYVSNKQESLGAVKDVGAAYRRHMGRHFPAMALVEVKDLLEEGAKVAIEATAALPRTPSSESPA